MRGAVNRRAWRVVPSAMALIQLTRRRTFDPSTGEAVAGGGVTRLEPQPAALLALLASRPGELVTHDDIRRHLWPDGRHVDYAASVHYAVRQVRRALQDAAGEPADIETLPRRGYRLREASIVSPPATSAVPVSTGTPVGARWRMARPAWAVAALVVAALVAIVEQRPNDHHARVVALVRAVHDAIY